jgi:hypothetical protein
VAPPAAAAQPPAEAFVVHDEPSAEELAARHEADLTMEADAVAHVVEDDDTLNLPPPPEEVFGARRPPPGRPRREPLFRTLHFKQTLIPILLTMGVLLSGIAAWTFSMGEESPLATDLWIPGVVLGIGVLMLLFAALTMLQVKSQLAASAST